MYNASMTSSTGGGSHNAGHHKIQRQVTILTGSLKFSPVRISRERRFWEIASTGSRNPTSEQKPLIKGVFQQHHLPQFPSLTFFARPHSRQLHLTYRQNKIQVV